MGVIRVQPNFQTEKGWDQPTLGGRQASQGLRESISNRRACIIQEKEVSRRRKMIRMGVQR